MTVSKCIRSLLLGHIFKHDEDVHAYQYNVIIAWPKSKQIGSLIQVYK